MLKVHRFQGESVVIINPDTKEEIWVAISNIDLPMRGSQNRRQPRAGVCIQAPKRYTIFRKEIYDAHMGVENPSPQHVFERHS